MAGGQTEPRTLRCCTPPRAITQPCCKAKNGNWDFSFVQHHSWHQALLPSASLPTLFQTLLFENKGKKMKECVSVSGLLHYSPTDFSLSFSPHHCQKTAASSCLDGQWALIAAGLEGAACAGRCCPAPCCSPTLPGIPGRKAHLIQTMRGLPRSQLTPAPGWFCGLLPEGGKVQGRTGCFC